MPPVKATHKPIVSGLISNRAPRVGRYVRPSVTAPHCTEVVRFDEAACAARLADCDCSGSRTSLRLPTGVSSLSNHKRRWRPMRAVECDVPNCAHLHAVSDEELTREALCHAQEVHPEEPFTEAMARDDASATQ